MIPSVRVWGLAVLGASSGYFSASPSSFVFHPWLHPRLPTLPNYLSVAADSTATPQPFCFDFLRSFDEIDMTGFTSERQHQAHSLAFYYLAPYCFLHVSTAEASFMWEQILWWDKKQKNILEFYFCGLESWRASEGIARQILMTCWLLQWGFGLCVDGKEIQLKLRNTIVRQVENESWG